jgi:hypothetical protein
MSDGDHTDTPHKQPGGAPDDGDGTWMTYRELAAARGIKHAAAIRLVQRNRWRKREGSNDGLAHVLVPPDALRPSPPVARPRQSVTPPDTSAASPPDMTPPDTVDRRLLAGALAALEDAVSGLREQLDAANARAERAEAASVEAGRTWADERVSLQADVRRAVERADALRDRLNTMQEQLADAHAALQAAEAADARAKQAEAGKIEERGRADRAEAATAAERGRADALRERIEALQVQVNARQEVIDAAEATRRAEDERRARGRWARLRAAWRGA